MPELTFLRDLAVVMAVSALTTVLFHLLRQPVVLGYIVAGVIIGPHTPPFSYVTDLHSIHTLAELGILLLLFSLGLEFDLRKLRRVGGVAFLAAILEMLLMIWLGYSAGRVLGWGEMDSLFLGALLSISSTTIIVQVLMETGQLRELFAQIILGILIVEDIAAIIILVILAGLATAGTITFVEVGWALLRVCGFMLAVLAVGYLLIPRLIRFVAAFRRSEMLTVTVLGLAFGLAVLGAHLGFSIALGAFLMGAIVAESREAGEVVERIAPIREMFTAVFFVATGMLLEPRLLVDLWSAILVITVITVVGKIASCSFATFLAGYPGRVALPVGLGMAQIGEFSFIIANLGRTSGVTGATLYPIAVTVSSLTTFLTPYLLRSAHSVTEMLGRYSPRPLVTFATFYTAWLSRLTDRTSGPRPLQGAVLRLMFYLATSVGLFVLAWTGVEPLLRGLPIMFPGQMELLRWGIAAIVAFPFLFVFGRTLESFTLDITADLGRRPKGMPLGGARLVRNSLWLIFACVAAVFVLAAGTPVLPPLVPFTVVVVVLLAATFFFWESLVRFHNRVEQLLGTFDTTSTAPISAETADQSKGRQEVAKLLSDRYGLEVDTEDFVAPFHPTLLNQTIQTLKLRTRTGASIIAIYRDPDQILVPHPDTVILPGDVLVLLGGREQLEAALQYLTNLSKQRKIPTSSPPQAAIAEFPEGSPLLNRTLAEMGFREELGVLVVGIRRGENRITNPDPNFRVEAGDLLYLWGPAEGIEEARRLIGSK